VLGVGIVLATREVGRIGSWIEMPWLASSVGIGAAGVGLLVTRALGGQAQGLPLRLVLALDTGAILFAVLLAGTVAQARHMRLITLQLAAANRRQAEQSAELANSEHRLQVLLDNVQTAVVVHAADSSIEFANPTASAVLGLTREQMLGRRAIDPAWHFVREDGSPMPVDEYPVSRVIREQQPLRDYIVGIHVAESEPIRWVLVDAVPALGQDGDLRQVIVSFKDISDRQQQKLALEQLAATDTLTGLATRRRLHEMADNELARARRTGGPLSLVMVDIDHFKSINDRFGHETGDRVLAGVAELLRNELRSIDLAARWGGEEFCLLLPDTNPQAALEVAERLRAAVELMPADAPDGSAIAVTASFGVATSGYREADLHQLVDAADQAMYRAKHEGRNRVRMAPGGASVPASA
jgi:diguanylate cyclase (GGDEF)-like protein/PAS domain S-box-containing protein